MDQYTAEDVYTAQDERQETLYRAVRAYAAVATPDQQYRDEPSVLGNIHNMARQAAGEIAGLYAEGTDERAVWERIARDHLRTMDEQGRRERGEE